MPRPRTTNHDDVKYFHEQGLTYREIGEMLGISGPHIYKIIHDRYAKCEHINKAAEAAINYILKHGGQCRDAIEALDLNVSAARVRYAAKQKGINLKDYFHYLRENRNWLVDKPERAPNKGNEIYVPALCKHCGHHQVIRAYTLGNQYGPKCTQCGGKGWFDEPRYSRSKVKKNL